MAGQIVIETSAIPDYHREQLARGALDLMEQVFSLPGAEERYQAWLTERRKRLGVTA